MIRKLLFLCVIMCIAFISNAQFFDWAKTIGGIGADNGRSIANDADGNVYTAGTFSATVDFDLSGGVAEETALGELDAFVTKFDENGNFVWVTTLGSIGEDNCFYIEIDADNNTYITGAYAETFFFETVDGAGSLISNGGLDIFIAKLNEDGDILWVTGMGAIGEDFGNALDIDLLGNVYVTGSFEATVDFGGGGISVLTAEGESDTFILKLDLDGNLVWVKQLKGLESNHGRQIIFAPSGIIITGEFLGEVDFDVGSSEMNSTSNGLTDVYVLKMDLDGNFGWVKTFGGANLDFAQEIEMDTDGNILVGGQFTLTVDFDPGAGITEVTSNGAFDFFILKLNVGGEFQWVKTIGGTSNEAIYGLELDASDAIYAVGNFDGEVDFDPSVSGVELANSEGGEDVFVLKLTENGDFVWAQQIGGAGNDSGQDLTIDNLGNVFTIGSYQSIADFNPFEGVQILTSQGASDIFILKLEATCTPLYSAITVSGCESYNSLSGDYIWTETGVYNDTIPDGTGCYVVVSVDLTINNGTTETEVVEACLSYKWPENDITYTESGIYTETLTNALGCDSIRLLDLTLLTVNTELVLEEDIIYTVEFDAEYQWLLCPDLTPIAGETEQGYFFSENGEYAVEITGANGCVETSDCIQIEGVGVLENEWAQRITVFPNPSDAKYTLDLGKVAEKITIEITDVLGKNISKETYIQEQIFEINLVQEPGIYFLRIQEDDKQTILQLVLK